MSLKITSDCVNCGSCATKCPNNAIYEGGMPWDMESDTKVQKLYTKTSLCNAKTPQKPRSYDFFYIVHEKCTECVGFYDVPQCAAVCPIGCCVKNKDISETNDELLKKKLLLHGN